MISPIELPRRFSLADADALFLEIVALIISDGGRFAVTLSIGGRRKQGFELLPRSVHHFKKVGTAAALAKSINLRYDMVTLVISTAVDSVGVDIFWRAKERPQLSLRSSNEDLNAVATGLLESFRTGTSRKSSPNKDVRGVASATTASPAVSGPKMPKTPSASRAGYGLRHPANTSASTRGANPKISGKSVSDIALDTAQKTATAIVAAIVVKLLGF